MSQIPPHGADRPRGAPPGGAPARSGASARNRAPGPRPKVSAATYWRRRVVVLGLGAGLLTTMSWAVNGLLVAQSTAGQALSSGSDRAPRHAPHKAGGAHASPPPSPSASSTPPAKHKPARRTHASGRTSACSAAGVRLTVSSPQYWYQSGKTPVFTARVVNTGSQPCSFDMGARSLAVVVDTFSGRRLWSSADCVTGSGSDPDVLASGAHAALHVTWSRRASTSGCGDAGYLVRPGEYKVAAVAGAAHSKSVNIVLGAKGAIGP